MFNVKVTLLYICAVFCIGCYCYHTDIHGNSDKIKNGENATLNNFNFVVLITYKNTIWQKIFDKSSDRCTGSIITTRLVITAAHCLYDIDHKNIQIVAGTVDLNKRKKTYNVKTVITHYLYRPNEKKFQAYDVGLIVLKEHIHFSKNVDKINITNFVPPYGSDVIIAGWGLLGKSMDSELPTKLQTTKVKLLIKDTCKVILTTKWVLNPKFFFTGSSIMCGLNQQTKSCHGDSGGPVLHDGQLIGIVCQVYPTCNVNVPDIYINLDETEVNEFVTKAMLKYP